MRVSACDAVTGGPEDAGPDPTAPATWTAERPHRSSARIERLRERAPGIALLAVLLLALALRSYSIESNPPELFEDEIAPAMSAWSIVTTGHDVATSHLPWFVTRLAYLPPVYGYSTLPFQAVLGHTVLAVRLPAILFGTFTTYLLYWIARVLGRRQWEAVLAALAFAVLPWAVHYGRLGFDPASTLAFTVAGVGLLWTGLARSRPRRVVAAGALLALGAYSYTPALMLDALLAVLVVVVFVPHIRRREVAALAVACVVAALVLIPYAIALTDPFFTQRTVMISVFRNGVTLDAFSLAWNHYWAQWDPTYLFLRGTTNLRNEPGMGVLLPVAAPLLVIGVVVIVVRRRAPDLLVLGWLAIGPLAGALTDDGVPHFLRGIYALPAIVLVIARGCMATWDWIGGWSRGRGSIRVVAAATLGVALAAQMVITYSFYFDEYPILSRGAWRYGEAASLAMVRDRVPAGGIACLDPAALSYWTFPQIVAWYLPNPTFTVVEGLDDPRCATTGSYLLAHPDAKLPAGATSVASVAGADPGSPFVLWRVGPSSL